MAVWTNITLTRAFNGWVLAAQQLKDKRASQAHAVAFWSSREVAQVSQAVCLHQRSFELSLRSPMWVTSSLTSLHWQTDFKASWHTKCVLHCNDVCICNFV